MCPFVILNVKGLIKLKLSVLSAGCKGIIDGNDFSDGMRRRLFDLGFTEGSIIECVGESLFSSPRAYLIKGAVFAVRNADAEKIHIKLL